MAGEGLEHRETVAAGQTSQVDGDQRVVPLCQQICVQSSSGFVVSGQGAGPRPLTDRHPGAREGAGPGLRRTRYHRAVPCRVPVRAGREGCPRSLSCSASRFLSYSVSLDSASSKLALEDSRRGGSLCVPLPRTVFGEQRRQSLGDPPAVTAVLA